MELKDYATHSKTSQISEFSAIAKSLPDDIASLCDFVQNLLIHAYWLPHYGYEATEQTRHQEMQLRDACEILNFSEGKSGLPINSIRSAEQKLVSICRDFSLLLCALLREKAIPARLRCGFATYLVGEHFEDHWVCEYWYEPQQCWRMVDAQLDATHQQILNLDFSPTNVPRDRFITAGKAWQLCRQGEQHASNFGIFNLNGYEFIKGNIIRDLFALSKIELMAWDLGWGILSDLKQTIHGESEFLLLDQLAQISAESDEKRAQQAIETMPEICFPEGWSVHQAPTIAELLG